MDKVREALQKLANEASAIMFREQGLRAIVGNTNVDCLKARIDEARAALPDLKALLDGLGELVRRWNEDIRCDHPQDGGCDCERQAERCADELMALLASPAKETKA